jgi:hypothetical protein
VAWSGRERSSYSTGFTAPQIENGLDFLFQVAGCVCIQRQCELGIVPNGNFVIIGAADMIIHYWSANLILRLVGR